MHASFRRLLYSIFGDHVARLQLARVRNLYQDLLIPVPYLSFLRTTLHFPAAPFSSLPYFTFVEDGTITR
jgi:hypothetical protein